MVDPSPTSQRTLTRAQEIFKSESAEYQSLIREVLTIEREVLHLRRRPEIHQKIYDTIKRVIK